MDLKDLSRLIKLCRTSGVSEIKFQGIELKLADAPAKPRRAKRSAPSGGLYPGDITEDTQIVSDRLTYDQLLEYSLQSQE